MLRDLLTGVFISRKSDTTSISLSTIVSAGLSGPERCWPLALRALLPVLSGFVFRALLLLPELRDLTVSSLGVNSPGHLFRALSLLGSNNPWKLFLPSELRVVITPADFGE